MQTRLLFATCTIDKTCTTYLAPGTGDESLQGTASVVAELDPAATAHGFVALYGDSTIGHGVVRGEARVIAHAGYVIARGAFGAWQLLAALAA